MEKLLEKFDAAVIGNLRRWEVPLARIAIFTVYFWFGILKAFGLSPAGPLVQALFERTIGFMTFPSFYAAFSVFEMVIGISFLVRGMERLAILLIGLHLFMTALPLVLLPGTAWQSLLIPTFEGQYIIKNILIAASAVVVGSKLIPISKD